MKYTQTERGRKVTEAILQAYDKLTYSEQLELNKLTNPLINTCQGLSREGALEIVGKIGIVIGGMK